VVACPGQATASEHAPPTRLKIPAYPVDDSEAQPGARVAPRRNRRASPLSARQLPRVLAPRWRTGRAPPPGPADPASFTGKPSAKTARGTPLLCAPLAVFMAAPCGRILTTYNNCLILPHVVFR